MTRAAPRGGPARRRVRQAAATATGVVLAATLTGCGLLGGGDDSTPTDDRPTSAPPPSSSADGNTGTGELPEPAAMRVIEAVGEPVRSGRKWQPIDIVVAYYGIYRDGKYAKLLMGTWLQSRDGTALPKKYEADLDDYLQFDQELEPDDPSDLSATGITLVDPQARKAYLVARDAAEGGNCFCPTSVRATPVVTTLFGTTHAATPAGADTIGVYSNVGYVPDVPVYDGDAPSPDPSHVPPGKTLPTVFYETPASDADTPAKAEVVDIDAAVGNLDLSVTEEKDKVSLAADVLFEFDKATLNAEGKRRVAEAAAILRKKADGEVAVNGYTDSKGSDSYNLTLSKRRAVAVQKELETKLRGSGITLAPKGYGEADPVAPNTIDGKDNPRGRKLNRRVEIVYGR